MDPVWPQNFQPQVVRDGFGAKLSSYVLALEAWRRGLTVALRDPYLRRIRVSDTHGRAISFIQSRPNMTKRSAHLVAKNKHRSNQLLDAAGVPVPRSVLIDPQKVSTSELVQRAETIGFPVVLKPRNGAMGEGVFSNIKDGEVLKKRYAELVRRSSSTFLVLESHVPGDDYRVLVFGGKYIAACLRVPANITGDGCSSVDELISRKNQHRLKNPYLSKGLIKKDQEVADYLAVHGYNYGSIPASGKYIRLRSAANASAGGDVMDVTEKVPQNIQESAVRAVQAVPDLYCAGVDVLFDASKAHDSGEHAILELNSQPEIGVNMYPSHGTGVDAPRKIIDICFPDSRQPREDGDVQLGLGVLPALQPIISGHAREVLLPSLPASRYRTRRLYALSLPSPLTARQRTRMRRASRENSVAGFIRRRGGSAELMAAGSDLELDNFIASVSSIEGLRLSDPRPWEGPVFSGFTLEV